MSRIDDAADQLLGLAERFRALLEVADFVKSIGSLDQAITERKAALAPIAEQHAAAKAELDAMQSRLSAIRDAQAGALAVHRKDCDAISETARAQAAALLERANSAAAALMAATQDELSRARQTQDGVMAEKQAALANVQSQIAAATETLAALNATHDATSQRIEVLRATAKSVLGD